MHQISYVEWLSESWRDVLIASDKNKQWNVILECTGEIFKAEHNS